MLSFEDKRCRACGSDSLIRFISFGKMPAANAFLRKEELEKEEYMYDMEVGFCEECKMVQLIEMPPYEKYIVPDAVGKTNYAFYSSTSKFMEEHFAELAKEVEERFLEEGDKVLEIGSNDGIMLKAFKKNSALGVEPSDNVADIARRLGIETISEFFTEELADRILSVEGKFKAILSTNVFLNIIEIESCVEGIKKLLDEKGVFITEDPYIVDILEKNAYDQIYDEHVWYFSLTSLNNLFERFGMEIFDAERQWVHGGSMRVYACKKGDYEKTERLKKFLQEEEEKKIWSIEPYREFAKRVEQSRKELIELLRELKLKGKKIVGYAAASKGTIVQNYCGVGNEILDYISDSTPFKQGLYTPGKRIPIVSPDVFHNDEEVDYALLSAWNHAKEIMEKEKEFLERGGRFIVHLPKPGILEPEKESSGSVEIKELKVFNLGKEGKLFETLRSDDKIYEGRFGQNLISEVNPGIIKGLHKHNKQTEYTTCVSGNILYVAIKENENGAEIKKFVIGEKNPIMLKTPPGIWHGYTPLDGKRALILYTMDRAYNPKDVDTEERDVMSFGDVWKTTT